MVTSGDADLEVQSQGEEGGSRLTPAASQAARAHPKEDEAHRSFSLPSSRCSSPSLVPASDPSKQLSHFQLSWDCLCSLAELTHNISPQFDEGVIYYTLQGGTHSISGRRGHMAQVWEQGTPPGSEVQEISCSLLRLPRCLPHPGWEGRRWEKPLGTGKGS